MLHLLSLTLLLFGEASAELRRAEAILHAEDRSTESLIRIIESQRLVTRDIQAIHQAIGSIDKDTFLERERATERLIAFGAKATALLERALQDSVHRQQPERTARLQAVLAQCDPAAERQRTWAAVVLLSAKEPSDDATMRLLRTLPGATWAIEMAILNAAQQHLPAAKASQLRTVDPHALLPARKAARVLFLHQLQRDETLPAVSEHEPRLRLATARVMSTTSPNKAISHLTQLCEHHHRGIRDEAMYLLRAYFQQEAGEEAPRTWQADDWRRWAKSRPSPQEPLPPSIAYRWGKFAQGLREDFAHDAPSIRERYLTYRYEHTVAAEAEAKNGRLYLRGNHDEGDQRLAFSAEQIAGAPTLTEPFRIDTALGGTIGNSVGWHVGVSIGNAKILFHTGYTNGAFRIEHCESHQPFVNNENMMFTPASNKLYDMTIVARPQTSGDLDLTVMIQDPTSLDRFHTGAKLTAEQVGPLNRIGLERSGRSGGDAMFDYIDIQLGAEARPGDKRP